jgi:enterochelin esterase-like enzyme
MGEGGAVPVFAADSVTGRRVFRSQNKSLYYYLPLIGSDTTFIMKTIFFFVLLGTFAVTCCGQSFQSFLNRVTALPANQRTAVVDSFMHAVPAVPFVEADTIAHFLYRGTASSVTVPGDANYWSPTSLPMNTIAGTNFWYCTKVFEADARLDYKFTINTSNWILDPLNPNQVMGGFGPNSEIRMPKFLPAPEISYDPGIPHGTFHDTSYPSASLGEARKVRVYLPPGYASSSDSFPMVLFHDGLDYWNLAQANNILDNCIAHGTMKPVVAVFIPASSLYRHQEYAGSRIAKFSAFIVAEVMPYLRQHYRILSDAASHATVGSSDGGDISLFLGFFYPDVFGNVAAQSSNIIDTIYSRARSSQRLNLNIYCDLGTYDIPELVPLVRNFIPVIAGKGYPHIYHEYHEGHSWGNWRAHISKALTWFFPGQAAGVREHGGKPEGFRLEQNSPNPFNPATKISYRIPATGSVGGAGLAPRDVSLKVYDVLGREVATLVDERQAPGLFSVRWDAGINAGGTYFYTLRSDGMESTKKMLLVR